MTLYFIELGAGGPIKIGYTASHAAKRMKQLQTGQPERLSLLGTIPGSLDDEGSLHEELRGYRVGGEWFRRCAEIDEVVQHLVSNQLPWYRCRDISLRKARYGEMQARWVAEFSGLTDASVWDVPINRRFSDDEIDQMMEKRSHLEKKLRNVLAEASDRIQAFKAKHGALPAWRDEIARSYGDKLAAIKQSDLYRTASYLSHWSEGSRA